MTAQLERPTTGMAWHGDEAARVRAQGIREGWTGFRDADLNGSLWERVRESGDWETAYFKGVANMPNYSYRIAAAFHHVATARQEADYTDDSPVTAPHADWDTSGVIHAGERVR